MTPLDQEMLEQSLRDAFVEHERDIDPVRAVQLARVSPKTGWRKPALTAAGIAAAVVLGSAVLTRGWETSEAPPATPLSTPGGATPTSSSPSENLSTPPSEQPMPQAQRRLLHQVDVLSHSQSVTEPVASSVSVPNGQYPVYVTSIDSHYRAFTGDIVQWFYGEAATKAAAEDRSTEVPPPNDYWVRNENDVIRTLSVSTDVQVTVNNLDTSVASDGDHSVATTFDDLAGVPARRLRAALFWITVRDGVVIRMDEQYVP